jgi:hypothetical protein
MLKGRDLGSGKHQQQTMCVPVEKVWLHMPGTDTEHLCVCPEENGFQLTTSTSSALQKSARFAVQPLLKSQGARTRSTRTTRQISQRAALT